MDIRKVPASRPSGICSRNRQQLGFIISIPTKANGKTREVLLVSALVILSQAGSICNIIHLLTFKGKMGDESSPQVKPMIRR